MEVFACVLIGVNASIAWIAYLMCGEAFDE